MKAMARAIAALFACVVPVFPGVAAQPAEIFGRWATDPGDCADNRYVWVFAEDRAALVIANTPLSGWRRPAYEPGEGPAIAVIFVGPPQRKIAWRIIKDGEIAAVSHLEDGRVVDQRSFQTWKRCAN